ncbi:MAG: hypothetical protein JNL13_07790 [Chitinophagaceae bacterium]|nr:hypothetical protein [Chitinophagaceae bacterium]
MKSQLLLPHRFKQIGWLLLVPATVLGIILLLTDLDSMPLQATVFSFVNDEILGHVRYFSFSKVNVTTTLVAVLFISGALLIGFSKEKREDEFISSLRQSSLLWAVLVNSILLLLAFLFIYGTAFISIMMYNMFTVLIIYIARFNYILYRNSRSAPDEKYN